VGHVFVPRAAGRACRCGKTGCLEALAGAPGIVQTLRDQGLIVDDREQILELVKAGNMEAAKVIRDAGRAIGEMLNMCISVVNPSMIVVGGMLSQVGENLLAGIREEIYANSTPLATKDLTIVTSRSGGQAAIIGAGILAAEYLLAPDHIVTLVGSDSPVATRAR
jgi:predicted NBD/HSP70 family sugar kinase